jgi:hypoxanthine phosphoribosyltransferase
VGRAILAQRLAADGHPIGAVFLTRQEITRRVTELGAELSECYEGLEPLLVAPLKSSAVFLSDLSRALPVPHGIDFLELAAYASGASGGVRLLKDLDTTLAGKDVLIVEDIVDTGLTLTYLQEILRARAPRTLRTACLLSKPSRRQVDVKVEYVGFTIEDHFVVGYGLDFAEQYRNLPYIGVIDG